jgi:ankyrin repeat protein
MSYKPTKEIFAMKLALACKHIRSLPSFREHPAQSLHLLLACDSAGYSPLHCAAASGNIELVTLLANIFFWLKLSTALDARDFHGQTALHWATMKGFGAVIQTLVESGASLNLADEQGRTPLLIAVSVLETVRSFDERKFCKDMIRYFLEHGANPNLSDEGGACPIHLASEIGDEDIIDLLISYGASVHVRDNEGESAVFYAIRGSHVSVITKLVEVYKIDILSRNEDGESAVDYARSLGDVVIYRCVESLVGTTPPSQRNIPVGTRSNNGQTISYGSDDFPNLSLSAGSRFSWDSLVVPSSTNPLALC